MARRKTQAIRKAQPETPEQIELRIVGERVAAIGLNTAPAAMLHLVPTVARLDSHGERGGGKTVKRLDTIGTLARHGLLTKRQFDAAEHFAERYQTGGLNAGRAQNYAGTGGGSSTPCLIPDSIRAVAARRQLDMIRTYLHRDDERLLIAVCVMGQNIGERKSGWQRAQYASVLAWLRMALDRVAAAVRL